MQQAPIKGISCKLTALPLNDQCFAFVSNQKVTGPFYNSACAIAYYNNKFVAPQPEKKSGTLTPDNFLKISQIIAEQAKIVEPLAKGLVIEDSDSVEVKLQKLLAYKAAHPAQCVTNMSVQEFVEKRRAAQAGKKKPALAAPTAVLIYHLPESYSDLMDSSNGELSVPFFAFPRGKINISMVRPNMTRFTYKKKVYDVYFETDASKGDNTVFPILFPEIGDIAASIGHIKGSCTISCAQPLHVLSKEHEEALANGSNIENVRVPVTELLIEGKKKKVEAAGAAPTDSKLSKYSNRFQKLYENSDQQQFSDICKQFQQSRKRSKQQKDD